MNKGETDVLMERSSLARGKGRKGWRDRLLAVSLTGAMLASSLLVPPHRAEAAADTAGQIGATYLTDKDNWGGGVAASAADGDLGVAIKNQNKASGDNYAKYPVEFKIAGVDKQPTKSAQLLIRAYDVDEFKEAIDASGEWDRVYFSSDPADIVLGAAYTAWPSTSSWNSNTKSSGIGNDSSTNGAGYKKEMPLNAYKGTLSGQDGKWNTTVLPFQPSEFSHISLGDNYVGITIHHYYQDTRATRTMTAPNTNWTMTVDWGQLIIDGGDRNTGEITNTGLKVEPGQTTIDMSFLPKVSNNNFSAEVSVIEKAIVNGQVIERNLGLEQKLFVKPEEGTTVDWSNIVIKDGGIDPSKEYVVNVVLFDDRGDGPTKDDKSGTNPGKAEHVVTFSTLDPVVRDFAKSGLRSQPTAFAKEDFQDHYFKLNGGTPNGANLQSVQIAELPDPAKGELTLSGTPVAAGDIIPVDALPGLSFVPVAAGFDGTVTFKWNGFNGTKFAAEDAVVTINSSPEVQDFAKLAKFGDPSLPIALADFEAHYVDPGDETLEGVKIVTLPAPASGKLALNDGNGQFTDIAAGQELTVSDAARVVFIPAPGATGTASFEWNGSDGLQYAVVTGTVTITINRPPVVHDIAVSGSKDTPTGFTANDFAKTASFEDADGDALQQARITVPSDFADLGTLAYTKAGQAEIIAPGQSAVLTAAELATLVFTPSAGMPDDAVPTFGWAGNDGKHDSEQPAQVSIYYNGAPAAASLVYTDEEGAASIAVTLQGTDAETPADKLVYTIESGPAQGTLEPDPANPTGASWVYVPADSFKTGTDRFTYTVTDEGGQKSVTAEVVIHLQKPLNGWAGDKQQGDPSVVKTLPGQPLKLSAVSSHLAATVTADVDGTKVPLQLANASTWQTDGYKQWVNTTFVLPATTETGVHTVAFAADDASGAALQTESPSKLADNKFQIASAGLALTAEPNELLGDGKSTTVLTARLTDENGQPIEGVEVAFSAPPGQGQFVGGDKAVTDAQGVAKVTYRSPQITGVNERQIPIQAVVFDPANGLSAKDELKVTFMPASIKGVVTKGGSNEPIPSASVRVTLDLNGDGIIEAGVDFDETVLTDANGAYQVIVPKGDAVYGVDIVQTIPTGDGTAQVTYRQTAAVGVVNGTGDETFDANETITGLALMKQPDGKRSLLASDMIAGMSVYVKKTGGNYIVDGQGNPKAFALDANGVFRADGLTVGEYELEFRYAIGSGQQLVVSRASAKVEATGEMNITDELIDPYGTITDADTKAAIAGAKVVLIYADTARNRTKGLTPGATVTLPAIAGFAPNDNASPEQASDAQGLYAYMVYPETDYVITVTKDGYVGYASPILSVERDIVRHDVELRRPSVSVPYVPAEPNVSLSLTVDANKVKEGGQSQITVVYKNESTVQLSNAQVKAVLPEGAVVIDAAGGRLDGLNVTWDVGSIAGGQSGSFKLTVQWPLLEQAESSVAIQAKIDGSGASAQASTPVQIYSDRFGDLSHYRYILGYPDKEFKPNGSLTRAELAAIVARLTDNGDIVYSLPYTDIREGHWATDYIKIATKYGLFGGYKDGTFRPDASVTRAELAAVMTRFLKLEAGSAASRHFTDTEGHWAGALIEALYNGKFLTGYPDGSFRPNDRIKRVEAVTMINRMLYRGPLTGLAPMFPDMPSTHWGFGDVQEATVSHVSERSDNGETWKAKLEDDVK